MSVQYDEYLKEHRENVRKGYDWICQNIPEVIPEEAYSDLQYIILDHDESKNIIDEYKPYDDYFYGRNRSYSVVEEYKKAWLLHLHRNPHHWQYWILINDDPEEGEVILEMPFEYIIEMICDWWSFSWSKGKLDEIFDWYGEHSKYMKLAPETRKRVENILSVIKRVLESEEFK